MVMLQLKKFTGGGGGKIKRCEDGESSRGGDSDRERKKERKKERKRRERRKGRQTKMVRNQRGREIE